MSLYNHTLEKKSQKYNSAIYFLVNGLLKRISKFYHQQKCNQEKFFKLINVCYRKIDTIESKRSEEQNMSNLLFSFLQEFGVKTEEINNGSGSGFSLYYPKQSQFQKKITKLSRTRTQPKSNRIKQIYSSSKAFQKPLNYLSRLSKNRIKSQPGISHQNLKLFPFQHQRSSLKQKIDQFRQIRQNLRQPKLEDYIPRQQLLEQVKESPNLSLKRKKVKMRNRNWIG